MSSVEFLARVSDLQAHRTPFVLATVVRAERPTSAKPGDRAVVLADGTIDGFVGGSCAESTVRMEGLRLLQAGESGLLRITPGGGSDGDPVEGLRTVGNPCLSGGTLEIFLESMVPPTLVAVFGESPVARALVRVGRSMEYDVTAITDPEAAIVPDTAGVVVASHGRDEALVLRAALEAGVPYVAVVASRRRSAAIREELLAEGLPAEQVARISGPAGLDIGARTAPEIALSVYADLLVARTGKERPVGGGAPAQPSCHGGDGAAIGGTTPGGAPTGGTMPGGAMADTAAIGSGAADTAAPHRAELPVVPAQTCHGGHGDTDGTAADPGTAIDPVCGMTVATVPATASAEHDGHTWWFCNPGCRRAFLADPAGFGA